MCENLVSMRHVFHQNFCDLTEKKKNIQKLLKTIPAGKRSFRAVIRHTLSKTIPSGESSFQAVKIQQPVTTAPEKSSRKSQKIYPNQTWRCPDILLLKEMFCQPIKRVAEMCDV